jgi:hypothetical protein
MIHMERRGWSESKLLPVLHGQVESQFIQLVRVPRIVPPVPGEKQALLYERAEE